MHPWLAKTGPKIREYSGGGGGCQGTIGGFEGITLGGVSVEFGVSVENI